MFSMTSRRGAKPVNRLVADANVLLSAVIGGRARLILDHPDIEEVFVTEATLSEVGEYAPSLAARKRLPLDSVLLAMAALPVIVVLPETFSGRVSEANRRMARRDPDDVQTLALALQLRIPIWSNDNDFEEARWKWFSTAQLLQMLNLTPR